jgi:N-hydroxyarylamine O-acetyltransferase
MRLQSYLERLNVGAPLKPTIETLQRLHRAHRETFLFENLTIQGGGAISVAIGDLERRFLDGPATGRGFRRGGYCFEHNTLFAAVLADVGFSSRILLGRVRRGPPERWARTHLVLRIAMTRGTEGRERVWLSDVGFGALGLVEPMPLEDGATARQAGLVYTLRREPHVWVLSMRDASGAAQDLYEFSEDPQTIGDVIVANHYTSTHPESVFRRALTVQSTAGDERTILRSDVLARYRGGVLVEERIDRAMLGPLALELFGVELPGAPMVFEQDAVCSTSA